jgi:Protein of unknown function (DUF2959)
MKPFLPPSQLPIIVLLLLAAGCAATREAYYNAWEGMGYAKRERLVDDVKAARAEQAKAKEEFTSALEQFKSVVNFQGGDLEKLYNALNSSYEDCAGRAEEVREKIQTVRNVGGALFTEWEGEIGQIKDDPSLKRQSERLFDQTHDSYEQLLVRMDSAAKSMDPVLTRFNNRVLFLKHNLNAQAIASLKGTELELGDEIDKLIKEMEASIAEADKFIAELQPAEG